MVKVFFSCRAHWVALFVAAGGVRPLASHGHGTLHRAIEARDVERSVALVHANREVPDFLNARWGERTPLELACQDEGAYALFMATLLMLQPGIDLSASRQAIAQLDPQDMRRVLALQIAPDLFAAPQAAQGFLGGVGIAPSSAWGFLESLPSAFSGISTTLSSFREIGLEQVLPEEKRRKLSVYYQEARRAWEREEFEKIPEIMNRLKEEFPGLARMQEMLDSQEAEVLQ